MGEVYQARDTRLDRTVAIKFSKEQFGERFEREAKAVAALNHPHVCQLYDVGPDYLVMEFVEGKPLEGPLPLDEALRIAGQIAEALEAAHEKGIVHRDLKPGNILLKPDGSVKVLDFGLAKVAPVATSTPMSDNSPTISLAATQTGVVLGTAAYMSPEQARGRNVNARTDVWAFGVVLYEMLTGKRLFGGEDLTETLASVVKEQPDLSAAPREVQRLLQACLQKDPKKRLQAIGDWKLLLDQPQVVVAGEKAKTSWLWPIIAAVLAIVAAAALIDGFILRPKGTDAPEMRVQIATPDAADLFSIAISPGGRQLVYQAKNQLWLRPLESETAQSIAKTEGGRDPFWSPDGKAIAYFAGTQLKKLDLASGTVQTLGTVPTGARGGTWSSAGVILFAQANGPILRVPAAGGNVSEATRLTPPITSHRRPKFLPGGDYFFLYALGVGETSGLYIGSLSSPEVQRLSDADSSAIYAPPGYIFFARQNSLLAQHFDLNSRHVQGDPIPVAASLLMQTGQPGSAAFAISDTGTIVYRTNGSVRQFVWYSRAGDRISELGDADADLRRELRLSPDGKTIAFIRAVAGDQDPSMWLMDALKGVLRRFTNTGQVALYPVWSPDGRRLMFQSAAQGSIGIVEKQIDTGAQSIVLKSGAPGDVSPDGRYFLYTVRDAKTGIVLWAKPTSGDDKEIMITTNTPQGAGRFSPSGNWIAYQSAEGGRNEIYIQGFPELVPKVQVSTDGGSQPEWRGDGHELFYVAGTPGGERMMSVPVSINGTKLEPGTPASLFSMPSFEGFVVTRDGQKFLVNTVTNSPSVNLLLNWKPQ
jgi:Tol biopolymer transport system component